MPIGIARANLGCHLFQVKRHLGNQNGVGVAGNAAVQANPAGVAPHHLHHHHALVALGGAVQAVQALGGKAHGGVKTKGGEGFVQVVVNGLGHAHHAQAFLVQGVGNGERTIPANGHQGVNFVGGKVFQDVARAVHLTDAAVGHFDGKVQRVALVGGAQNGAATVADAAHGVARQAGHAALRVALGKQNAVEPVMNAVALPAPVVGGNGHGLNDGIKARGIATAGVDGNAPDGTGHENSCGKSKPLSIGGNSPALNRLTTRPKAPVAPACAPAQWPN